VSKHETPLTRAYWKGLDDGTLYEEFRVVDAAAGVRSRRDVDGVVILGQAHRIASQSERVGVSLDDKDVVVIQTKATPLNPYVFGQALLSMDVIRMRWAPRSLRSVLICTADDPYLRPVIDAFPDVEVHVARSERRVSFGLTRLPGAAADLASQRGALLVENPRLTPTFRIDGVIVPSYDPRRQLPLAELVVGEKVITVHSEASAGRTRRLGMWMSGEVIAAQRLLLQMGAAAVHSIVLGRRDQAVEEALRRHASFEILEAGPATRIRQTARGVGDRRRSISARPEGEHPGHWQADQPSAEADGRQRGSRAVRADASQEFIPGNYCRLCGWPFPASRRRARCEYLTACQRRQQLPLHLREYGCPHDDRVHPEWRDQQS
jgi:hypothetical protein